ncbi:hypothetical protein CRG98_043408 [Punica granatum]|uniref:RNase H type-1 domain-containing protein n=1 Tax=Punica granatum TaxID=22663 RepID=A0A2I0HWY2_PUNGR|nr:hypothetical protein CRG98_043408 [Punica granatum]
MGWHLPSQKHYPRSLPILEDSRLVSSVLTPCRDWDLSSLPLDLPPEIAQSIHGLPIGHRNDVPDKVTWGHSHNEQYSSKIGSNASATQSSILSIPRGMVFTSAIWILWKNRNSPIFSSKPLHSNSVDHTIQFAAEFYASRVKSNFKLTSEIQVRWEPSLDGLYVLNSDGCSRGNTGIAVKEGLI